MRKSIVKGILTGMVVAVGLMGSTAMASETYTINASEMYKNGDAFVHKFATEDCTASVSTMGTCNEHGMHAVMKWANDTFFDGMGDSSLGTGMVPGYDASAGGGYDLSGNFNAFATVDSPTSGQLLSLSLPADWVAALRTNGSAPLTAPTSINNVTEMEEREMFIDQILIGYVETGDSFAMNFRTQLTFGDSNYNPRMDADNFTRTDCAGAMMAANCATIIDQRLEQGDTDMENLIGDGNYGGDAASSQGDERIISAFQQNFSAVGNVGNVSNTNTEGMGGMGMTQDQNIEQNMEGYFYSCMNCSITKNDYAFSAPKKLTLQTWMVDNPDITSIIHTQEATQTNRRSE